MGTSKALLPFGDETMLERMVRLLGEVAAPMVVVAARDQPLPQLPKSVLLTFDERESRGPLEGLRAGLKALPDHVDAAYTTSCDVPLLVPAFVRRMIELLGNHDICVPVADGYEHPLAAVYRRGVLTNVESLLAADRLRMMDLFDAAKTRRVESSELRKVDADLLTLRNLNNHDEYLEALRVAGLNHVPPAV
jgi:molybdopterin-guanine dinucleotide biosynthesis protein A